MRAVIFCSETVFPSDLERVQSLLAAVPLIEYGMGETGVMAYCTPASRALTFLWDAFHCHVASADELVVTSLQPFRFPLVNYGTGDRVQRLDDTPGLPFRCARVAGRTRTVLALTLRDGRTVEVHSELLEDCLDLVPEVRSYFIRQTGHRIEIAVRVAPHDDLAAIRRRFLGVIASHRADLDESKVTFSHLTEEPFTLAGKRQYVVCE